MAATHARGGPGVPRAARPLRPRPGRRAPGRGAHHVARGPQPAARVLAAHEASNLEFAYATTAAAIRASQDAGGPADLDADALAYLFVGPLVYHRLIEWATGHTVLDLDDDRLLRAWVDVFVPVFARLAASTVRDDDRRRPRPGTRRRVTSAVRFASWTSPRAPSRRCCGPPCVTSARSSGTTTTPRSPAPTAARRSCGTRSPSSGFLGVHLPEEYGGGGAGMSELAIVCEELAAVGCPLLLILVSPGDLRRAHQALRHRRAARPLAPPDGHRHEDGVRDHRARRRVEQPQHRDHRDARRRRLPAQRLEDLHLAESTRPRRWWW